MRVGIDLVGTDEVREALRAHDRRYLERVYTDRERRDCHGSPRLLAGRFAAKEAVLKALGRDEQPVPWKSISVTRAVDGGLSLELTGEAQALARRRGVRALTVTVAQQPSAALAIVSAELHSRQ